MKQILAALVISCATTLAAQDVVMTYPAEGSFDDTTFALENALIERGLVVDHISHVGEMLARTGADLGSDVHLYDAADVYLFCSAVLSRKMMEADPLNIAHCPYGIFVMDQGGTVTVGHRVYPDGPMKEVETYLSKIAQDAALGF